MSTSPNESDGLPPSPDELNHRALLSIKAALWALVGVLVLILVSISAFAAYALSASDHSSHTALAVVTQTLVAAQGIEKRLTPTVQGDIASTSLWGRPFVSGAPCNPANPLDEAEIDRLSAMLKASGDFSAAALIAVVGSHDSQELSTGLRGLLGSNLGLAEQRAACVVKQLQAGLDRSGVSRSSVTFVPVGRGASYAGSESALRDRDRMPRVLAVIARSKASYTLAKEEVAR